jgi:hypothetical protein
MCNSWPPPYTYGCQVASRAAGTCEAERRQQQVREPHQRDRHADDAAVIVRGNLDVAAIDREADDPTRAEQRDRRPQSRAERPRVRCDARIGGCVPCSEKSPHDRDGNRRNREAAAETHQPRQQPVVLDGADVVGEVDQRRHEHRREADAEQQCHHPRR